LQKNCAVAEKPRDDPHCYQWLSVKKLRSWPIIRLLHKWKVVFVHFPFTFRFLSDFYLEWP